MTRAQVQHLQERIDVQLDIALDKAVERARLVGATDWELRIYTREVRQCLDAQKVRILHEMIAWASEATLIPPPRMPQ